MAQKSKKQPCCGADSGQEQGCRVESLITVDERGQMVLPKDLRKRADIKAGDKFVLVSWENGGSVCCLSLIKAENFIDTVKDLLGPMMKDVLGDSSKE